MDCLYISCAMAFLVMRISFGFDRFWAWDCDCDCDCDLGNSSG